MGRTATRAAGSELLNKYPLNYKLGPYVYQASRSGEAATYSVADGTNSFTATLHWAFGIRMGQSFLFEKNGGIYMAPLTYYPEAERYYAEAISIPMFATLSDAQQDQVVDALRHAVAA